MSGLYKEIDIAGLQILKAQKQTTLIDVRTDAEVAQGMIEGALHIPLHLLPARAHELPAGDALVFYCRSGGRSAQACLFLASSGNGSVYNLQGGITAWVQAGQQLAAAA